MAFSSKHRSRSKIKTQDRVSLTSPSTKVADYKSHKLPVKNSLKTNYRLRVSNIGLTLSSYFHLCYVLSYLFNKSKKISKLPFINSHNHPYLAEKEYSVKNSPNVYLIQSVLLYPWQVIGMSKGTTAQSQTVSYFMFRKELIIKHVVHFLLLSQKFYSPAESLYLVCII